MSAAKPRADSQAADVQRGLAGAGLVRAILAQAAMELRLLVRAGESLIVTLGVPLGLLGFFSTVDVLPTGEGSAVEFLVPGVLAIAIAATGLVAVSIQTAFERKYGVLKRLGATPLPAWAFVAAKAVAVSAVVAVQAVLVLSLAAGPLGWRPTGGGVAVVAGMLLGAVACTSLGMLIAGTMRAEATLAFSNALFLALLLVSGVAFDAAALPEGLAAIGELLPLGALGELLRVAFEDGRLAGVPAWTLAAWAAAALLAARRWFRWEP